MYIQLNEFSVSDIIKIAICDIQGRIISQQSIRYNRTELDISTLEQGIYLLKVSINDKTELTRFLKE